MVDGLDAFGVNIATPMLAATGGAASVAAATPVPNHLTRGRGPYKAKAHRQITQEERDGLRELVEAIRGSWQRAKGRQFAKSMGDKDDAVYHYMNLPVNRTAKLPMVWKLQEIDTDEFKPGQWFAGLLCSRPQSYQGTFNKLVGRAETQVEGFQWLSWQQVEE